MNHESLSYEDEQLQIIIMNEIKERSLQEARRLRELQDIEYQESLDFDLSKDLDLNKDKDKEDLDLDEDEEEISLEEMREIRLQRFSKY